VSLNLDELLPESWKFLGALGLSYEFLFIVARTLCRYVCELASSSNIQLCLCAYDYPAMLSLRKELMLLYYVSGNVLILEFNLQW
jgi:hypothetical protein